MENEFCPCCGRRCPLTNPSCERGVAYAKTGAQEPSDNNGARDERPHDHRWHHHGHHGEHHHKH